MSEETTKAPETIDPAKQERIDAILKVTCKKHQKIFMLLEEGVKPGQVAKLCGTNGGHVGNVKKDYANNPEKATNCKNGPMFAFLNSAVSSEAPAKEEPAVSPE